MPVVLGVLCRSYLRHGDNHKSHNCYQQLQVENGAATRERLLNTLRRAEHATSLREGFMCASVFRERKFVKSGSTNRPLEGAVAPATGGVKLMLRHCTPVVVWWRS